MPFLPSMDIWVGQQRHVPERTVAKTVIGRTDMCPGSSGKAKTPSKSTFASLLENDLVNAVKCEPVLRACVMYTTVGQRAKVRTRSEIQGSAQPCSSAQAKLSSHRFYGQAMPT